MPVPEGAIAIWSGLIVGIPAGWNLCDGTLGTPDLRARFVRGAPAVTEAGTTGGSDTHIHDIQSAGNHTHTAQSNGGHTHTVNSAGAHNHGKVKTSGMGSGSVVTSQYLTRGAHQHTTTVGTSAHTHTMDTLGSHTHTQTGADDTRPPYYEVLYIQATVTATVATGIIIIWSGLIADIPTGWNLCDGGASRPDLRGKFVRGAPNGDDAGGTGGSATHQHTTDSQGGHIHTEVAGGTHYHTFTSDSTVHNHYPMANQGTGTRVCQTADNNSFTHQHANSDTIGSHTHTHQTAGAHTHTCQATSSLPAYYDVLYIYNTSASDIPQGGILIWVGLLADIPLQYDLCDGTNPRPELRTKFIRGADIGVEAGGTGGNDVHNHTDVSAGGHAHTQDAGQGDHQHSATNSIGAHTHGTVTRDTGVVINTALDNSAGDHSHTYNSEGAHIHTLDTQGAHTHTIDSADTRPAYYEVQFIYRTTVAVAVSGSGGSIIPTLLDTLGLRITKPPKIQLFKSCLKFKLRLVIYR